MRTATLTALFLLAGIATVAAEPDPQREKLMAEPRLTQPVLDAHNLASRKMNILRLRAIVGQPSVPPPGPGPAGSIPVITTP